MKGRAGILALILLVGLLVMTGCEKRYTGSETDTAEKADSEKQTESAVESETESEIVPDTVLESVETEKVTETKVPDRKDFESSLGYHILYDDTLFEYSRTGDYDEIVLKGQTFSSKPPVFFAAMKIDNDDVQDIVNEIFTMTAQQTVVGKDGYTALCQPTAESEDGKTLTHHNQYLVLLENGDALLFETQWYEEDGEDLNGKRLKEMLDSIIIDLPVQENIAQSQTEDETEKQPESEMNGSGKDR